MTEKMQNLMEKRRSRYQLDKNLIVSEAEVEQIVKACLWQAPSAFNVQSARVSLLVGKSHEILWNLTKQALRAMVPAEQFASTEEKINSFAAAYGTILYWEDTAATRALQEQFPLYKDNFPVWAQQANGMLQFAIWTALAEVGVGASLQHYNPLIDAEVKKQFSIAADWQLIAQMPFGNPTAAAEEKTHLPLEDRFHLYS